MKKILSKSRMREVMPLPHDKSKKSRTAVFEQDKGDGEDKVTILSNSDFKFLRDQEDGPFSFFLNEGTFVIIDNEEKPKEKSPLEKKIEKFLDEKKKKEDAGKKFHPKAEAQLQKLLSELEESKDRQK